MFSIHKFPLMCIIKQDLRWPFCSEDIHILQKHVFLLLYENEWPFFKCFPFGPLLKSFHSEISPCPSFSLISSVLLLLSYIILASGGLKILHPECFGKVWMPFNPSKLYSEFSFLSHSSTCMLTCSQNKPILVLLLNFFTILQLMVFLNTLALHTPSLCWNLLPSSLSGQCNSVFKTQRKLPPVLKHLGLLQGETLPEDFIVSPSLHFAHYSDLCVTAPLNLLSLTPISLWMFEDKNDVWLTDLSFVLGI